MQHCDEKSFYMPGLMSRTPRPVQSQGEGEADMPWGPLRAPSLLPGPPNARALGTRPISRQGRLSSGSRPSDTSGSPVVLAPRPPMFSSSMLPFSPIVMPASQARGAARAGFTFPSLEQDPSSPDLLMFAQGTAASTKATHPARVQILFIGTKNQAASPHRCLVQPSLRTTTTRPPLQVSECWPSKRFRRQSGCITPLGTPARSLVK